MNFDTVIPQHSTCVIRRYFLENHNFKSRKSFEFDEKMFQFWITSFILFNMLISIITDWGIC